MIRPGLVLLLVIITRSALAEGVPANHLWLGAHISGYAFDVTGRVAAADVETGTLPGARAGWRFAGQWSLQGTWQRGDVNAEAGPGDFRFEHALVSARHHYRDNIRFGFEPYTGALVGRLDIDGNGETVAGFEFGWQRPLARRLLLDVGLRPSYSFDRERWDGEVFAGINLTFRERAGNVQAAR